MIILGKWTRDSLGDMLRKSSSYATPRERINYISSFFLDVPYKEATLIGDFLMPEEFVINLREVDCFTFIEYVEAMRLSGSFQEFEQNLKTVRYRSGRVSFTSRKHFFTDWSEYSRNLVCDATKLIGGQKTLQELKHLNIKEDGTAYVHGVEALEREIAYLPSHAIDNSVIDKLETGDYIGVCSAAPGLDVSHVGIFIRSEGKGYLMRHASSEKKQRKVTDQAFESYIAAKPGIIVLRPKKY